MWKLWGAIGRARWRHTERVIERDDRSAVELYLLRHADAGDPAAWRGDDSARPLSDVGRRQASSLGRFLQRRAFHPDLVLSSPKMRSRQTAELVLGGSAAPLRVDDRLAAPLDLAVLDQVLAGVEASARKVLLVGHDPDFSRLAAELSGAGDIRLKKGSLVRIDVELPLQAGSGRLRWLLPSDLVG